MKIRTVLTTVLSVLAMAAAGAALMSPHGEMFQGPAPQGHPPPPPGCGGPHGAGMGVTPDTALKGVLGFTDAQIETLHALMDARRQSAESLWPRLQQAEKALADEAKAGGGDPAKVGQLFLALDALRDRMAQADDAFRQGFTELLTAEQKQTLEQLRSLQGLFDTCAPPPPTGPVHGRRP